MTDYIFIRRSRNAVSTVLHTVFNIALSIGSVAITFITQSWAFGIILVILSKWRIFAVRPRYWGVNIKSNLVDIIVGISFVLITYCTGNTFTFTHIFLAIAYTLWLLLLKPLSSELATEIQALVSIYLGTTAIALMAASANSFFVVVPTFLVGYAATRHILVQSEDHDFALLPLAAGLISSEIAWLCQSWLTVYTFPDIGLIIPQISIIMTIAAFDFGLIYKSILKHEGKVEISEIVMPAIFSIILIAILVIWFSKPAFHLTLN